MLEEGDASWECFTQKLCDLVSAVLEGKGTVSVLVLNNERNGSVSHRSSLLISMEESDHPQINTMTIGDIGLFHTGERGVWYCVLHLDTIAMIKYSINDIRLFWSKDRRILQKFMDYVTARKNLKGPRSVGISEESSISFQGFSLYPPTYTHDVSFWLHNDTFDELLFCSAVRAVTFDLVREVCFLNQYVNRKISYTYRLVYQSCDGALTKQAANQLQSSVRGAINKWLGVEPR